MKTKNLSKTGTILILAGLMASLTKYYFQFFREILIKN